MEQQQTAGLAADPIEALGPEVIAQVRAKGFCWVVTRCSIGSDRAYPFEIGGWICDVDGLRQPFSWAVPDLDHNSFVFACAVPADPHRRPQSSRRA